MYIAQERGKQGRKSASTQRKEGLAMADRRRPTRSAGGVSMAGEPVAQRRVVLTADNPRQTDTVEYNSIAFGRQVAGGDFQEFKNADFSTLADGEPIAFVGHGKPGHSGSYRGKQLADKLTTTPKKMPDGGHNIVFTSCYAGSKESPAGNYAAVNKSVMTEVAQSIKKSWPGAAFTVRGAQGPSVKKTDGAGEAWAVINDTHIGLAGELQTMLEGFYGINVKALVVKVAGESEFDTADRVAADNADFFNDFIALINRDWVKVSARFKAGYAAHVMVPDVKAYVDAVAGGGGQDITNPMEKIAMEAGHRVGVMNDAGALRRDDARHSRIRDLARGTTLTVLEENRAGNRFKRKLRTKSHHWVRTDDGQEGWVRQGAVTVTR